MFVLGVREMSLNDYKKSSIQKGSLWKWLKTLLPVLYRTKDGSRTIPVRTVFILLLLSIILTLIKLTNLVIWSHSCLLVKDGGLDFHKTWACS